MKRYSCKVCFKDSQVHGNARVYVWAEEASEVYDKAAAAIKNFFKSPVIVTSVTYQALKSSKRRAPGKAVAPK